VLPPELGRRVGVGRETGRRQPPGRRLQDAGVKTEQAQAGLELTRARGEHGAQTAAGLRDRPGVGRLGRLDRPPRFLEGA